MVVEVQACWVVAVAQWTVMVATMSSVEHWIEISHRNETRIRAPWKEAAEEVEAAGRNGGDYGAMLRKLPAVAGEVMPCPWGKLALR